MKKLLLLLIALIFLTVSCSSSKKAENDIDILPDEDEINDEDTVEPDKDEEADNDEENEDKEVIEPKDTDEDETENVDPCDPNSCIEDKHSNGSCLVSAVNMYECGCVDGYLWNGKECVNPCVGFDCGQFEHTVGECKSENPVMPICDCETGYWWWGKDKGCLKVKPAAINICTGQTKCYDNEKEIMCPAEGEDFFGQDAQYAELGYCVPQSFSIDETVSGEPVVVDNNTGNMWQQKIPQAEELYYEEAYRYCEDLTYGGYDDWRLPSMEDLMTIADYGKYDPAADTEYFPDSGSFWTSTRVNNIYYSGYGDLAYYDKDCTIFNFTEPSTSVVTTYSEELGGFSEAKNYPYSFNIRCIRVGNFPASKYHFISETFGENLMWNNHNNLIFAKTNEKYTWKAALKYCSELDYAGISNWRLPNIKELTLNSFGGARTSTTKPADFTSDYSDLPYNLSAKEETIAETLCVTDDQCKDGKFWNGTKCAKNPCADDPCQSTAYSDKVCIVVDEEIYACNCDENYFWNSGKKQCLRSCEGTNPCQYHTNSDYECYPDENYGYYCGCNEPYYWNVKSRKCVQNCDAKPCQNKENSTGVCYEDDMEGYYCGCVEGYHWDTSTSVSRCRLD